MAAFIGLGISSVIIFTAILALAIYNSYYFLYKQKRYRIYFITTFYIFATLTILTRLILSIILSYIFSNYDSYLTQTSLFEIKPVLVVLILEIVATYS